MIGESTLGMNWATYWLLDTAAVNLVPLSRVHGPARSIVAQWNKRFHGLSRDDCVDRTMSLFESGDIFLELAGRIVPAPNRHLIDRGMHYGRPTHDGLFYGLTAQGGSKWERLTDPDWRRFYNLTRSGDELTLEAADKDLVHRALRTYLLEERLKVMGLSPEETTLAPWQPVYWKQLPSGERVRLQYEPVPHGDELTLAMQDQLKADSSYFRQWYRDPFATSAGVV